MAKPTKPESQPSAEITPKTADFSRAHPLMRSLTQSQELLERQLGRKNIDDFKIKEVDQWKVCVNAVANTTEGKMLLKSMLQYSGVFNPPDIANANKMITNTLKGSFYLTWIRPYLETDVRRELE